MTTEEKNIQDLKEAGKVTKGMYVKDSHGLPVIYTPMQDYGKFISVYCRGRDGIPLILDVMLKDLENEYLSEYKGKELSEKERLEITIKAGRQAQKIWNTFWDSAKKVKAMGKCPFVIRMRPFVFPKKE